MRAMLVLVLLFPLIAAHAAPPPPALIVANDHAWPPFSYLDADGRPNGLLIDLWRALAAELGRPVTFRLVDWQASLDLVRDGEADVHAGLFQSPSRDAYLDFSDELVPLSTRLFIGARSAAASFDDLRDQPVGITAGGFEQEYVREHFPHIALRPFPNNKALVQAALRGDVDAFVADYPVGMYYLHKLGSPEQFRVVDTLYARRLHSAVADGRADLLAQVNHALQSLPAEEKERIVQKWMRTEQVAPTWLIPALLGGGGAFLLLAGFAYTVLLRRQVRSRTAALSAEVEERKAVERTLRASEESYRNLFDAVQDAIYIHDLDGRFLAVNQAVENMYGYPREYFIGKTPDDLGIAERNDRGAVQAAWRKAVAGTPQRFEFWGRRANGEAFPKEVLVNPGRYRGQPVIIAVGRDITEVKRTQERLEELAYLDDLTRLPNRRMLADRMHRSMAQANRRGGRLAVCYIDLDGFKPINDKHGHAVGDRVLVTVAERLGQAIRAEDTAARLGGDEFVVLLGALDDTDRCVVALERLLTVLAMPHTVEDHEYPLTASIGVTLYPDDDSDPDTLLRHADQAMYRAKQTGRNRYHFFDTQQEQKVNRRREQLRRFGQAIDQGELRLYYQPKVDMRRGRILGVEALVRWQHPERGLLPPAAFLPLLEGDTLMLHLDAWVLHQAVAQLDRWRAAGVDLNVSINVSAPYLQQPEFLAELERLLATHGNVGPAQITLEILETAALEDLDHVSEVIATCAEKGIAFALDDFGTGYSSLTYFRRLPARILKIDQSFVRDMLEDSEDLGIVDGVVRLAQVFRREVIAEGVETAAHGAMLLGLGCEQGQGYGIARPMPAAEIPPWCERFRPPPLWCSTSALHWERDDLALLSAEAAARDWVEGIAQALRGSGPRPTDVDCAYRRFSQWYEGPARVRYAAHASFATIGQRLQALHRAGHGLLAGLDTRPQASEQHLETLFRALQGLLDELHRLQLERARGSHDLARALPGD